MYYLITYIMKTCYSTTEMYSYTFFNIFNTHVFFLFKLFNEFVCEIAFFLAYTTTNMNSLNNTYNYNNAISVTKPVTK